MLRKDRVRLWGVTSGMVHARARGRAALGRACARAGDRARPRSFYGSQPALAGHKTFGRGLEHRLLFTLSFSATSSATLAAPRPARAPPTTSPASRPGAKSGFDRSVGFYGWMDTMFPGWVDNVVLALATPVALPCARELVRRRHQLRARLPELGATLANPPRRARDDSVPPPTRATSSSTKLPSASPATCFPLLLPLGALVALAVRGAGRRWMPVAGAALVVLLLGHGPVQPAGGDRLYYG